MRPGTVAKFCFLQKRAACSTICTQVVQTTQASIIDSGVYAGIEAVSDSEPSIFLQWVWLESNSIGATPTRQPSLKTFGLAMLAGLY